MAPKQKNKIIEIFSATYLEAEMVKGLLENEDIQAFIKDGHMGTLAPWNVSGGGAGAVKVMISERDYEKAHKIVAEYTQNINKS